MICLHRLPKLLRRDYCHLIGIATVCGLTNEAAVASKVKDAGYDPYEKKLLGITAISTMLGKKKFEELLGELVYKPPGKPTLVPESDKRPAMNTAQDDFNE